MGLGFQPSAGADPVQVAVDVEFEQISGRVAWAPGLFRPNPIEARGREIKPINERLDKANRVLRANVVVQRFRQKESLGAVFASEVPHAPILAAAPTSRNPLRMSFHTVCLIYATGAGGTRWLNSQLLSDI
jgi:hypothetical protein